MAIDIERVNFKGVHDLAKFYNYYWSARGKAPKVMHISKRADKAIRTAIEKTVAKRNPLARVKKVGEYQFRGVPVRVAG